MIDLNELKEALSTTETDGTFVENVIIDRPRAGDVHVWLYLNHTKEAYTTWLEASVEEAKDEIISNEDAADRFVDELNDWLRDASWDFTPTINQFMEQNGFTPADFKIFIAPTYGTTARDEFLEALTA